MTEAIIVAIITASATVICQLILSRRQQAENETKQAVRRKEYEDRLKAIEQKLDEHNNYAEKITGISIAVVKMQKDIEYLLKGDK